MLQPAVVSRVEISLSFLISGWVLVEPGLEFPNTYQEILVPLSVSSISRREKLIGALLGANEEFFVSLEYEKSICIWLGSD